jgi:hypothetical protein
MGPIKYTLSQNYFELTLYPPNLVTSEFGGKVSTQSTSRGKVHFMGKVSMSDTLGGKLSLFKH